MKNKTKTIRLRVTDEEYMILKKKSEKFQTVSGYLRCAISEFSDADVRMKLDLRKNIAEKYSAIDEKLAHLGGNLNQTMRKINELSKAGLPTATILRREMLPKVQACYDLCFEFRRELEKTTRGVLK